MKIFNVIEVSKEIEGYKDSILKFCLENGYLEEREQLEKKLTEIIKESQILISFIGQYSAGKSTIVSALTGRNDIKIDADISTNEVTMYRWFDQLVLVDTPGLHTENKEHDELTREAILESDILVYCITNELFDPITKSDYIKLLYEKNYKGKVFLVINKMSREFGEYDVLKENYIESINDSLEPYKIQDVSYNFIDTNDYLDGISEGNQELIEYSHFEEFIDNLNIFVEDRKLLGKLSKPIDLMIGVIDDLLSKNIKNKEDINTIKTINKMTEDIIQSKNTLEKKSIYIVENKLSELREYGNKVAHDIGNIDINEEELNANIMKVSNDIDLELDILRNESMDSLRESLNLTLDSNIGEVFFENIKKKSQFIDIDFNSTDTDQVSKLLNFIDKVPKDNPIMNNFKIPIGAGAKDVAQGNLHLIVKGLGGKVGYKFKPWEAVNIAKNIGKGIAVLGVALELASFLKDINDEDEEEKSIKKILNAQSEFRSEIGSIIIQMRRDYENIIADVLKWYDDIQNLLKQWTDEIINRNNKADALDESLLSIRENLQELKKELTRGEINE